jgi:hypothetical protein
VRYAKPATTFEEQADLLLRRGMIGDRATLIARLSFVNYYRLSAYWWPFRKPSRRFAQCVICQVSRSVRSPCSRARASETPPSPNSGELIASARLGQHRSRPGVLRPQAVIGGWMAAMPSWTPRRTSALLARLPDDQQVRFATMSGLDDLREAL